MSTIPAAPSGIHITISADLTIAQAAEQKQVSAKSIRRWIAEGRLPAYRIGARAIRIRREDLDQLGHRIPSAAS